MLIVDTSHPTRAAFFAWLEQGEPGTAFPYFWGDLQLAREAGPLELPDAAWAAHERGDVELVQGRNGPGQYVYLAVKRRRRRKDV